METLPITLITLALLLLFVNSQLGEQFPKEALPTESGYLNIKAKPGALMFYAYYEAIHPSGKISDTPIILWLQGGPGCSGLLGNFYELGPWRVQQDLRLHKNTAPWNRAFGLLFLDNPIGSGFSVAPTDQHIPTNQEGVATDLYSALQAFYNLNPAFRSRPFYVTGESYAGKYVPSLAYYMVRELDKAGEVTALRIDGLAIGNGLTHPEVQVQSYARVAYAVGLIDSEQKAYLEKLQDEAVRLVKEQKWIEARVARNRVFSWLANATGHANQYDFRRALPYHVSDNGTDYVTEFVNSDSVKAALKADVNRTWVDCSEAVGERMAEDVMKSTKWMVERLLRRRVPVLLYQGQFDLRDGPLSTDEWIRTLQWGDLHAFWGSERRVWRVSKEVAGYVRAYANLTQVVVAGAGHLVPADQNLRSQAMIESWIDKSLGSS